MSLSRKRQIQNLINENESSEENQQSSSQEPIKEITFAPGCFDGFEGTQEELDALINEIRSVFANSSFEDLQAMSRPVDMDELIDDIGEEAAERLLMSMEMDLSSDDYKKKLN